MNKKKIKGQATPQSNNNFSTVEYDFLEQLIQYRVKKSIVGNKNAVRPKFPDLKKWNLPIANFIKTNSLNHEESVVLLLALAPHYKPDFIDNAIQSSLTVQGQFPQLGGSRNDGKGFRGFIPTAETALFLLDDDNLNKRLHLHKLFWSDHYFNKHKILWIEDPAPGEPIMSGKIILARDYIDLFLFDRNLAPQFGLTFPAHKIETKLTWDDLVLTPETLRQVNEIQSWLKHGNSIREEWDKGKRLKPGCRVLFYGPPGTGKTFTASLLGKGNHEIKPREVYRVDLSMVVSKFIGETEKNLESLFSKAENKNWILFFDEADALFGKRTGVRDAHDKYANQEVSYLLQRLEDFEGLVILASNMKMNIDEAFLRRFNDIIKFPFPSAVERAKIWATMLPPHFKQHASLVSEYELSGGGIVNALQLACLRLVEREGISVLKNSHSHLHSVEKQKLNDEFIKDIEAGIKREFQKEGKAFYSLKIWK